MAHSSDPERIHEYWGLLAVVLFVLVSLDMLTTVVAAAELGVGAEANPLVRWALGRGILTLVTLNLGVVGLTVGLFWGLIRMLHRTPERLRKPFALLIEVWLGLLLVAGLFVLTNNLAAILLGESLL